MAKLFLHKDIVSDSDKMASMIDGISLSDVKAFIDSIPESDDSIDIEIHSCGGDTTEGYAIYDAIRSSGKKVTCTVVGECSSMASVILLAAPFENRVMSQHAKILIHSPFFPQVGAVTRNDIGDLKTQLDAEHSRMLNLYADRTGADRNALESQMDLGTQFGSEVAKRLGFISKVLMPTSASINNNSNKMSDVTVGKSWLDKLLAKAGYAKMEDVKFAAMDLTTADGATLTVEREDGDVQVGDAASPDGEFVMPDGYTIVVVDGIVTDIIEPVKDETTELKEKIAKLEEENEKLKASAKSESDNAILQAVSKAGGKSWLEKVVVGYSPSGKIVSYSTNAKKTQAQELKEKLELKRK